MKTNKKQKNIPTDWKLVTLSNIGEFSKGSGITKSQLIDSGLFAVRYGELYTKHHFKVENVYSFISEETAQDSKEIFFGDILFAGSGETIYEIGKSAVYHLQKRAYAGGDIIIFRSNNNTNSLFLSYFLNIGEARKKLRELGQGQSVVHVYKKDLETLSLHLPPLHEQNRIVPVLETWDSGIEKLKEKIAIKKEIKKGLMQELLTGKKRLPGFSDKWKEYILKDIAEFKKGSGISKNQVTEDGKNPCLLYGEIYTKYDELILDIKSYTNTNEGVWSEEGDVFVPASTTTNALDLATATTLIDGKVLVGGDVNIIRNKKGLYDPIFLSYYLSHTIKRNIAKYAQGVTIIHLYGNHFKKEKILIPSRKEQEAIVDIIKKSTKEILTLEDKLKYKQEQKKYLLNNLVTGQIRTPENLLEINHK